MTTVTKEKKLEALNFLRSQAGNATAQQMENAFAKVGLFMGHVVLHEKFRSFSIKNNTQVVWEPWTVESFTAFIDANIQSLDRPAVR